MRKALLLGLLSLVAAVLLAPPAVAGACADSEDACCDERCDLCSCCGLLPRVGPAPRDGELASPSEPLGPAAAGAATTGDPREILHVPRPRAG